MVNALGQAFFSLSLGMGILVTYSSYFPKETKLTKTAVTVSLLDLFVAIMMGIIIFPAVKTFGLDNHNLAGTALVFVTLPEVFAQMPWTQFWSILFFTLLLVAALTSTISLGEVSIAFMQSRFGLRRSTACLVVMLPLFVLSALCSLSLGSLSSFTIAGLTLFDFLDNTATNIMLPVVAISTCIYMGWFAPKKYFRNELTNGNTVSRRFYGPVLFVVRFVAPVLIAVILLAKIF